MTRNNVNAYLTKFVPKIFVGMALHLIHIKNAVALHVSPINNVRKALHSTLSNVNVYHTRFALVNSVGMVLHQIHSMVAVAHYV